MFKGLIYRYLTNLAIVHYILFFKYMVIRPYITNRYRKMKSVKIYYGCGDTKQPGYINVDIRWTPAIDILGNLEWCRRNFANECEEVYLSHVLEHYGNPGKAMRSTPDTVLGALRTVKEMLKTGGKIRIAVPDFEALTKLYFIDKNPLYPRVLGRIFGEQDYPQNCHKCCFDSMFLKQCLEHVGFHDINVWVPEECGIQVDSSFDQIENVKTSLNLIATKL